MNHIYYVYTFHPFSGENHRVLSGKFLIDESGYLHVLEDHTGYLRDFEELDPDILARKLQSLQSSMYTEIVSAEDIALGKRPDLLEVLPTEASPDKQNNAVYQYHRVGMEHPQTLAFQDGEASLDNFKLSDVELQHLLENLRQKKATIRKLDELGEKEIQKFEQMYESITKADPELAGALGHIRSAIKAGTLDPSVIKTLTGHIFKDSMVPSMGNKKAYEDFMQRPRKGVHIRLDGNDFGSINKVHGFETGNEAIKQMFTAVRKSLDESVGRKNAKSFRIGGDEGHVFVPTHQHAASFVRALKANLAKIPPVNGTHSLSMSVGVGTDANTAEHALIQAKTAKKAAAYKMGEAKTHAYSAVPGFEGHLTE